MVSLEGVASSILAIDYFLLADSFCSLLQENWKSEEKARIASAGAFSVSIYSVNTICGCGTALIILISLMWYYTVTKLSFFWW